DVRWEGPVPPSQVVRTPLTRRPVPRVAPPPDDVSSTGPVPRVAPDAAPPRPAGAPGSAPTPSVGPTWTIQGPVRPAAASAPPSAPDAPAAPRPPATPHAPAAGAAGTGPVLGAPPAVGAVPGAGTSPTVGGALPTLDDLLASRPRPAEGPAELGWRAVVRRATGGLLAFPPGPDEQRVRESVAAVQRRLDGPRTVVVINPKGGAHKTTATLLLAATFGSHRGRSTLAWDNNETRGTLGWRSEHGTHQRTAVDLLDDLHRFEDPTSVRVGDLDAYVRAQSAQFDVLASDEDAASAASIDAFAFRSLHRTLQRFYRILVVDTGNNMRASNWQAAIDVADQVVVVSTVREDTSQSAAWALDALRAAGKEDVVRRAVTVLSDPATRRDPALHGRLHDHFGRLTRAVLDVPYDASLVSGGPLDVDALSRQTREAWLHVAAAVADGL
ncbi:MAG: chromosome partitioning protein, partial [Actinotalea sp.]|nr:chromosome partitioning protein [Actinotalea sp.]